MPRRRTCRILAALLAVVVAWNVAPPAIGENGQIGILPKSPNQAVNGVQFEIDTRGVDGNGYRPIRVRVKTTRGLRTPRERQFLVRLQPDGNYWEPNRIFEKVIVLPVNAAMAEDTIPIRQASAPDNVSITVFEGGETLRECRGSVPISRVNDYTEMWPSMLFVDSRVPTRNQQTRYRVTSRADERATFVDYRAIACLSPVNIAKYHGSPPDKKRLPSDQFHYGRNSNPRVVDVLSQLEREPRCTMLPPKDIPTNWRDMSSLDLAFISVRDLVELAEKNPERLEALADWTRSGRSLFVYRDRPAKVAAPPTKKNNKAKENANAKPATIPSPFAESPRDELKQKIDDLLGAKFNTWVAAAATRDDALEEYELANSNKGFVRNLNPTKRIACKFADIRDCGLGRVVYVDESPFTMPFGQRAALLNVVGMKNWSWRERTGVSMITQNSVFWSQLIPGLGLPPVNLFLISMTLFVIVVGPVSYYFLRKQRKLFLIMVIAPLASSLMLIALLAYAFLSDGSGMKIRVRGVTFLDGKAGRTSSMSYQTYYSAMGGGAELRFPTDTTVFPVLFLPNTRTRRGELSVASWTDGQRLKDGYLRPRTMTQFAVNRSAASSMALTVSHKNGAPEVNNGLRTPIVLLYIRDEDGFHICEDLPTGEVSVLKPIQLKDLSDQTKALMDAAELLPPEGFSEREYLEYSPRIYYGQSEDHAFGMPTYKTALIERKLTDLLGTPERTPVGGFVAVVKFSPAAPVGSDSVERFDNLEVVFGRWK